MFNIRFWAERVSNIAHCIANEATTSTAVEIMQGQSVYSDTAKSYMEALAKAIDNAADEEDGEAVYQQACYYYEKLDTLTDSVETVLEALLSALEFLLDEYESNN